MPRCSKTPCPHPAAPGYCRCLKHVEKDRVRSAARYRERRAAGLCVYASCTKPTDGKRACAEHRRYYDRSRSRIRRSR